MEVGIAAACEGGRGGEGEGGNRNPLELRNMGERTHCGSLGWTRRSRKTERRGNGFITEGLDGPGAREAMDCPEYVELEFSKSIINCWLIIFNWNWNSWKAQLELEFISSYRQYSVSASMYSASTILVVARMVAKSGETVVALVVAKSGPGSG